MPTLTLMNLKTIQPLPQMKSLMQLKAFRTAYFEYKVQHGFGYGNFGESEYIKSDEYKT